MSHRPPLCFFCLFQGPSEGLHGQPCLQELRLRLCVCLSVCLPVCVCFCLCACECARHCAPLCVCLFVFYIWKKKKRIADHLHSGRHQERQTCSQHHTPARAGGAVADMGLYKNIHTREWISTPPPSLLLPAPNIYV
jgi:hypothetical protein